MPEMETLLMNVPLVACRSILISHLKHVRADRWVHDHSQTHARTHAGARAHTHFDLHHNALPREWDLEWGVKELSWGHNLRELGLVRNVLMSGERGKEKGGGG